MQVSIEYRGLSDEVRIAQQRRLQTAQKARDSVRAASLAVERRVKGDMPVDTGRARASWGHWTPGDTNNPEASNADALWQELDAGLAVTQGSNVPYIEGLNAGHSTQAPAGFIDLAEEVGQTELDKLLDDLMRGF